MSQPSICFYGDDFTGASENLAQYHRHGLKSRLYFEPADPQRVKAEAPGLDVIGIAGVARSRAPHEMRLLLDDAFALFGLLGTRLNQYKICSTFDSAVNVGNFAIAIEAARHVWPDAIMPVLPATPDFGRYTAFGNHFSRHRGDILRLDRNPALVDHPSTPMHEADLRRHLIALGVAAVSAIMLPELGDDPEALALRIVDRSLGQMPIVLDTIDNTQLEIVSTAIWHLARERPVFALAAQGLPQGIGRAVANELGRSAPQLNAKTERPNLVLSGSCSPQTAVQLDVAEADGWAMIRLPIEELKTRDDAQRAVDTMSPEVVNLLNAGQPVAVFTARGEATESFDAQRAPIVGEALASLFRQAVRHAGVRHVIFAGGDSSSYAMRASGAYALEIAASTGRQAGHTCRLIAEDELNGVEVMLKGGQAGGDRFFVDPMGD